MKWIRKIEGFLVAVNAILNLCEEFEFLTAVYFTVTFVCGVSYSLHATGQ
jgi:hypothetical protein